MHAAIAIGSIICIVAAISGDTSQDLKTGYLLGATPKKQQYAEIIGVVSAAFAIGGTLYLLDSAWHFGSAELPAPQATLMKMVVEGVMGSSLPWTLVICGAGIAVVIEILGIPVLPFAVGLYLPIHLSTPIMAGGLLRWWFERRKYNSEKEKKDVVEDGILYTSGLIAGEGLVGILLAVCAIIPMGEGSFGDFLAGVLPFNLGNIGGLVFFALLLLSICKFSIWKKRK